MRHSASYEELTHKARFERDANMSKDVHFIERSVPRAFDVYHNSVCSSEKVDFKDRLRTVLGTQTNGNHGRTIVQKDVN